MDNVQNFTGRASDYTVGRPSYSIQLIDFLHEQFIKRSLSASYSIKYNDDGFTDYICELEEIFNKYAYNNKPIMPNKTVAYIGNLE